MTRFGQSVCWVILGLCLSRPGLTAASEPIFPTILVEPIEILDPQGYAQRMHQVNAEMKATHGVPLFLRAYTARGMDGRATASFQLSPALSFESLLSNQAFFAENATLRESLAQVARPTGAPTYLKAIRFDGTNQPGWLINTLLQSDDESVLVEKIEAWMDRFPESELRPKVNLFRVLVGSDAYSHLLSINTDSGASLGKILDYLARTDGQLPIPRSMIRQQTIYQEID